MWLTAPNRIGVAAWQIGDSIWRIDARGERDAVALAVGQERIALVASDGQALPRLDEQFVRDDQLHLSFPQTDDSQFGFRLVVRPVPLEGCCADGFRIALELLVSVQTTLLDSHPTLDLVLPARSGARDEGHSPSGSRVYHADNGDFGAAIILGPQDVASSGAIDQPDQQRLRLFGEFLEKGVIRRARPWLIVDRSSGAVETRWIGAAIDALAESPLPLN
ncbi:hypothetical protein Mal15_09290 [Stieleria maiorica]|uniref:Uncharacterized protein n=1 Tax=Stieleria maiorica TaxID=2795974 RepID=A0A5B9M8C7_9BACT|nr:hypothetical protein [Stieleria maiorica]QEF96899.1 hypothetical protein Mal15_09290 [Stieleria maiorica]